MKKPVSRFKINLGANTNICSQVLSDYRVDRRTAVQVCRGCFRVKKIKNDRYPLPLTKHSRRRIVGPTVSFFTFGIQNVTSM